MLGPFDRYTLIEIGIAAVVVGVFVLVTWWQQPPKRQPRGLSCGACPY